MEQCHCNRVIMSMNTHSYINSSWDILSSVIKLLGSILLVTARTRITRGPKSKNHMTMHKDHMTNYIMINSLCMTVKR